VRSVKVGTNSPAYTTDTLKNGDYVSVNVTHNNICLSQPIIGANIGTLTVLDKFVPAITLTGNTVVTQGDATVISATVSSAGTGYQLLWQDSTSKHDWADLPAQQVTGAYAYNPSTTGDKIRCVLTVTASCATINVVNSPALGFIVNKVTGIDPVPAAQYGLRYYPNPVQKTLIIDSMRLADRWRQLQITGIDGKQTFL